jgi:phospholipase A2
MKKIICTILTIGTIISAAPMRDIPLEYENQLEQHRMPQFMANFYENLKETIYNFGTQISQLPEAIYSFILQHPHYHETAHVRFTNNDDICQEEKNFLEVRAPQVRKALEKLLNITFDSDKTPRIGLVFSGGGFRAMLSTLGFMDGAHDIGLLDCCMYCVGLSGSTWGIAPWIASAKSLKDFSYELRNKLYSGIDHINDPYELSELFEIFVTKLISRQFISTMDIYGSIIANTLLKGFVKNPMLARLTESHAHIKNGLLPLPIYTAIQSYQSPYEWMEFSPFEIGSSFLKAYIPTWAYGRKFKKGISTDHAPEQTLGYFLGVFGSAFEVNLKDIVTMSATNLSYLGHTLPGFLTGAFNKVLNFILDSFIGELRLFPSMLLNYTFECEDSPIKDDKTIGLVDAGIDFNLPLAPLLRQARNIDLIVIYDASANIQGAPELIKAMNYAQRKGLKFPPIDIESVDKNYASVFKNLNDPETPVIIYFPRIKNDSYSASFDPDYCIEHGYCNTFNFNYTPEEAGLLSGFAEFSIKEQQHVIKETIKDILVAKYGIGKTLPNSFEGLEITGIA